MYFFDRKAQRSLSTAIAPPPTGLPRGTAALFLLRRGFPRFGPGEPEPGEGDDDGLRPGARDAAALDRPALRVQRAGPRAVGLERQRHPGPRRQELQRLALRDRGRLPLLLLEL